MIILRVMVHNKYHSMLLIPISRLSLLCMLALLFDCQMNVRGRINVLWTNFTIGLPGRQKDMLRDFTLLILLIGNKN